MAVSHQIKKINKKTEIIKKEPNGNFRGKKYNWNKKNSLGRLSRFDLAEKWMYKLLHKLKSPKISR